MYKFVKDKNRYVLSISNHADLVCSLLDFVREEGIESGEIRGLGAVDKAVLRFYDPQTKKYVDKEFSEQMEIANLTGNISVNLGEPYLHLHIVLGRSDYSALAGHLLSARISGACELVIDKFQVALDRYKDEETQLNMYRL